MGEKFTRENRRIVIAATELHAPRKTAAHKAGITDKTLRTWLDRGLWEEAEDPTDPETLEFVLFRREFLKAEAIAEETLIGSVIQAAPKDWKAAAWLLERRFTERWGYKQRLEHTGPDGGPIEVDARKAISERLAGLVARASAAEGSGSVSSEPDE